MSNLIDSLIAPIEKKSADDAPPVEGTSPTPPAIDGQGGKSWYDNLGIDIGDYYNQTPGGGHHISPLGIGAAGAGIGALAGGLLPKKGGMWKRLLTALLGAGLVGGGGYMASKYLGGGKGLTFGGSGSGDAAPTPPAGK